MKLKNLLPILAMVLIVLMSGCKKVELATGAIPKVTSTNPSKDATDVALNKKLTASFSETMNGSSISPTTFILKQGETAIEGIISYNDTVAIFEPSAFLTANTTYTATITTLVESITGMAIENDYEWSFTTAPVAPPTVFSTHPENDATHVALDRVITVTFSDVMDITTINNSTFTLKQGETLIPGTIEYSGTIASYTPSNNLISDSVYQVTVTTGVKNLSGIALTDEIVFTFTAGIISAPYVTSANPADLATDIALNQAIEVSFSEPMDIASLNEITFIVYQGETPVNGTITYADLTATFTPAEDLLSGTVYTAIITSGVKNENGIAMDSNYHWTFTTVSITLPTVLTTNPLNDAVDVNPKDSVTANFSVTMDAATINATTFTVFEGLNPVEGIVSYTGTEATFIPTVQFADETLFTATLTTGAKDLAGNALLDDKVWSFTTGIATVPLAVVDLGASGNYVVLAKTMITNNPTSDITGDMAVSPAATSFITGFALVNATGYAESSQVTGQIFAADMAPPTPINLTTAVENMITAYNDAAGRPTPDFLELLTGNIGGQTLTPGLYKWTNTVTIPSDVTISGGPNDVWIFQIAGDLSMASAVNVTLEGGAQAKNIFWQVAGQATFGATSHFEGIILSKTSVTFQSQASFNGRALAQTAVILDANTVVEPQ